MARVMSMDSLIRQSAASSSVISLGGGLPAPELFPRKRLTDAFMTAMRDPTCAALQYDWPEGQGCLREWVAQRLRQRGARVDRSDVIITAGAQQGIALAAHHLLPAGARVRVAAETYPAALDLFRRRNAELRIDDEAADCVYFMDGIGNPHGLVPDARQRAHVVAEGLPLIVDEAYAELSFDGSRLRPLIADAPDRVWHIGTLSKTLCPGLRIGWLGDLGGHLPTEPGVLATCEYALEHFRTVGCAVESVVPEFDLKQLWNAWIDLRSFSVAGANAALYRNPATHALLKPEAVWEIERGMRLTALQVYDAARVRSAWYQVLRGLFEQFDFLVLPAAQVVPFNADLDWPHEVGGRTMDTYHRWMEVTIYATFAGLPAISVPAGFDPSGRMPAGLQLIGRPQGDAALLHLAAGYEALIGEMMGRLPE